MKHEKCEWNSYSINNTNSFRYKKLLFQIMNNFSKSTAKKYCNIISLNSHKKHTLFFEFEGNIMNVNLLVRKVSKIKYKIFTESLFNIHFILFLYLNISILEVQKHFLCLTHKLLSNFKFKILLCLAF